jgi:hypothetical protein
MGKQDLTAQEAIFRFEQAQAEAEAKKNKEIAVAQAREENEANRFRLEEEKRTHVERQRADEQVQIAEQAKLRSVQVSEQGRIREVEIEKVRVAKAHDLEEVGRSREVNLNQIEMNKQLETEKRSIADIIRARVAVDKTVAVEEESIKDLRVDAEAKRQKNVTIVDAEAKAQGAFIVDIKRAEADQQVAQAHAKKQLILADAAMEASDKEARAAIRRAEGTQAEHAAPGLADVRVKEADAVAIEKVGLAQQRVRDAQVQIADKEGNVVAENVRRKLLAEVAGRDADAAVTQKRMIAEATGLAEKAKAMQELTGAAKDHEEYRLRLDADRTIALEQIKARVQMAEAQARVMGETMGHADIKIVGGDGQFFDRFIKAVSLGSSIDGVFDSSDVVRRAVGPQLPANGGTATVKAADTLAILLSNLMVKADDTTKGKLKTLLDQAKQLGVHDDKVS